MSFSLCCSRLLYVVSDVLRLTNVGRDDQSGTCGKGARMSSHLTPNQESPQRAGIIRIIAPFKVRPTPHTHIQ